MSEQLEQVLGRNKIHFHQLVNFYPEQEKLLRFDFSKNNPALTETILSDTGLLSQYINNQLQQSGSRYGIGGYNEERVLYNGNKIFEETGNVNSTVINNRSVHLGIDIWAPAGTKVYVPQGGMVHSFAFNDQPGDYGATIILQHQIETIVFHTLYGHVSLKDLDQMAEGKYLNRGDVLGYIGTSSENGGWPPHLHFQIIADMQLKKGDYPGVCLKEEREKYLYNCPDADLIVNMMQYAI